MSMLVASKPRDSLIAPSNYQGCTVADASDGKLWCSTSTDSNGNHIGGRGFWGHCETRNCQTDQSTLQL